MKYLATRQINKLKEDISSSYFVSALSSAEADFEAYSADFESLSVDLSADFLFSPLSD